MTVAAIVAGVALASYLSFAAVAKALAPAMAARALEELGIAASLAKLGVRLGVVLELSLATALILRPRELLTYLALVILFGVFAGLGVAGLRAGRFIDCGCVGPLTRWSLGWPQLVQLPLVLAGGAFLYADGPHWSVKTGLPVLSAVEVGTATMLLATLAPIWHRLRQERISLAESRIVARRLGWQTVVAPSEAQGEGAVV